MTLKRLALLSGMSEQTLHRNIRRNSMETKYLVEMAKVFDVSPSYFLQEDNAEPNVLHDPPKKYVPEITDRHAELLEEIRELSKENRELQKQLRDAESELRSLKSVERYADQKSNATK